MAQRTAAIRRARRWHQIVIQLPFYVVLAVVVAAAILVLFDRWRRGAVVFGAAFLAGAAFRALLPTTRVGLLQVRSRPFDIAAMTSIGLLILWLATSIDSLGTA